MCEKDGRFDGWSGTGFRHKRSSKYELGPLRGPEGVIKYRRDGTSLQKRRNPNGFSEVHATAICSRHCPLIVASLKVTTDVWQCRIGGANLQDSRKTRWRVF